MNVATQYPAQDLRKLSVAISKECGSLLYSLRNL